MAWSRSPACRLERVESLPVCITRSAGLCLHPHTPVHRLRRRSCGSHTVLPSPPASGNHQNHWHIHHNLTKPTVVWQLNDPVVVSNLCWKREKKKILKERFDQNSHRVHRFTTLTSQINKKIEIKHTPHKRPVVSWIKAHSVLSGGKVWFPD